MRRAALPLAYSEGFTPHPHISFAAPLPVGVVGRAELADVFLSRWVAPQAFLVRLGPQLPAGLQVMEAYAVGLQTPSLQSLVYMAEYEVRVKWERDEASMGALIKALLAAGEISWSHRRGEEVHSYDLRSLIEDVWLAGLAEGLYALGMRLRCDVGGSGRPEQVVQALLGREATAESIDRTRLLLRPAGAGA